MHNTARMRCFFSACDAFFVAPPLTCTNGARLGGWAFAIHPSKVLELIASTAVHRYLDFRFSTVPCAITIRAQMTDDLHIPKGPQIATNLRLLLVVEEIAKAGRPMKPMELSEALGLPKPTVHRLVQTGESEGFLQRDLDGRSYGPGPRLRKLAMNTMSSEHLRTGRFTILKAVAEEIGETCNLATPDNEGMTYLDRVETHWPLRIQLPVGTKVPFHCTASGKLYLSTLRETALEAVLSARSLEALTPKTLVDPKALRRDLAETRARGYSQDDEEFMSGMTALAVPVNDSFGRLLATLSVHAPGQRHSVEGLLDFLPTMQTAAIKLAKLHGN